MPFTLQPRHRNDTHEDLVVVLQEGTPAGARDLSGVSSITLTMTNDTTMAVKINRAACTWSNSPTINRGYVTYAWQTADVNAAGRFRIQWEIVFIGGKKFTWPSRDDYAIQVIMPDLDSV